jgi:hypothetical protein
MRCGTLGSGVLPCEGMAPSAVRRGGLTACAISLPRRLSPHQALYVSLKLHRKAQNGYCSSALEAPSADISLRDQLRKDELVLQRIRIHLLARGIF